MITKPICSLQVFRLLTLALMTLLLIGCKTVSSTHSSTKAKVSGSTKELMQKAQDAMMLPSPGRESRLLDIAETLALKRRPAEAIVVLQPIDPKKINNTQYARYAYIYAISEQNRNNAFDALNILDTARMQSLFDTLSSQDKRSVLRLKAQLNSDLGNLEDSLAQRIELASLLTTPKEQKKNERALWRDATRLPESRLSEMASNTKDPILKGWYELATIEKRYEADLKAKKVAKQRWSMINTKHPASRNIDIDPRFMAEIDVSTPQRIALLLPTSGELAVAGRAIEDGFMVAHEQAQLAGQIVPSVQTYDTAASSIDTVYALAVADGADMVIGPLDKEELTRLSQQPELPVTTLALNYFNTNDGLNVLSPHPRLFQFGIAPEDDGRQIAEKAWQEGHRSALMMRRASDWSIRAARSFTQHWQAMGGVIVGEFEYNDENLAQMVKQAVRFNRYNRPKRRTDMDMIVMLASPQEGRQIIPALDFYFAKDVPVYSSRHIYANMRSDERDNDLEAVRFTALPWVFDNQSIEKKAIKSKQKPSQYYPLYALGIDAFALQQGLSKLTQNNALQGLTGQLTLGEGQRVNRDAMWGYFKQGQVEQLPASTFQYSE